MSIAKGYLRAVKDAVSIGANTFQFFTRNPRGGNVKALDEKDLAKARELMAEHNFGPLLAHAPYTMNLCSDKADIREFARNVLKEDIERMRYLPDARFLFHPGSHVGQGSEQGISYIIDALNEAVTDDDGPLVLLEGMTGKGSEIGSTFEELAQIIQGVKHSNRMGIVIDTCHLHSAGYDIVNDLDGVLAELDRLIGIKRIGGVHLNDNMYDLACHKDRHAKIGEGSIGLDAIAAVVAHPSLSGLPFSLETPNELDGYAAEIKMIREKIGI